MKTAWVFQIAATAVFFTTVCGCSATGKSSGKTAASVFSRKDDESLRKAVEKDPFPRAPGALASGNIDKPIVR